MSTETMLLLLVVILIFSSLPAWPYSKSWGYRPIGILSVFLVVFLVWAIAGGRPLFRRSLGENIQAAGQDMADSVKRAVN